MVVTYRSCRIECGPHSAPGRALSTCLARGPHGTAKTDGWQHDGAFSRPEGDLKLTSRDVHAERRGRSCRPWVPQLDGHIVNEFLELPPKFARSGVRLICETSRELHRAEKSWPAFPDDMKRYATSRRHDSIRRFNQMGRNHA